VKERAPKRSPVWHHPSDLQRGFGDAQRPVAAMPAPASPTASLKVTAIPGTWLADAQSRIVSSPTPVASVTATSALAARV
jgi:hypothetical protein